MNNGNNKKHSSRRYFMKKAGVLTLAASPLSIFAARDTSEGITFADGWS